MSTPTRRKIIQAIAEAVTPTSRRGPSAARRRMSSAVFGGTFNRTVSANLGWYSICTCSPRPASPTSAMGPILRIRGELRTGCEQDDPPTTIPHTLEDLLIAGRGAGGAALRFDHHKSLARGAERGQQTRTIGEALRSRDGRDTRGYVGAGYDRGSEACSATRLRQQAALMNCWTPTSRKVSRCWPWTASHDAQWASCRRCTRKLRRRSSSAIVSSAGERRRTVGVRRTGNDRDVAFRGREIPMRFGTIQVLPWRTASWRRSRSSRTRGFNAGEGPWSTAA